MSLLRSSSTARIASAKSFRNVFVSCPGVSRARAVRVAALNHKEPSPQPSAMLAEAKTQLDRFFQRYDVLSTGMGALVVTSYCVLRGQDTGTALSLTIGSTVLALVVNELMGSDGPQ